MFKRIAIILFFIVATIALAGCSSQGSASQAADTQVITAQKGTIKREITPSGNLQMPRDAKLTFGAAGVISQVLVKVGETVEEAQVLARLDATTVSTLQQELLKAEVNVKLARMNLENAKTPTLSSSGATVSAPDPLKIESMELSLLQTQMAVETAQKALDGAIVTAPFAGLVSQVNSKVADRISSSTVIVRLIDPTQLGVTTLVNETDIFNIKLGTAATVQIDALPQFTLPATVSSISPTATISGGVVNFPVELQVKQQTQSIRPTTGGVAQSTGASQPSGTDQPAGTSQPAAGNQSSGTGRAPGGNRAAGGSQNSAAALLPTAVIPTLKEGLSVSITVTIEQKDNVILVPSRAVTRQGANSVVQVMKADNTTEQRIVKTGISDWQNVEITQGLTEGDKLVVAKQASTTTTPRTNTQQQPARIPGMPQIGR
jgi:RND family efflux transporter MFP subunit